MPRHVHAKPLLRPLELTDHLRGLFYLVRSHPPGGLAEEALKILNQQQWSACLMIRAALCPTATHRSPAPSSSQESQGNRTLEDRVWLYFFFGVWYADLGEGGSTSSSGRRSCSARSVLKEVMMHHRKEKIHESSCFSLQHATREHVERHVVPLCCMFVLPLKSPNKRIRLYIFIIQPLVG